MRRTLLFIVMAVVLNNVFAEKLYYHPFDSVTIYRPPIGDPPSEVVLFISGDGGWNLGVLSMAQELAGMGALVVGIDMVKYMRRLNSMDEKCHYPAGEFELLSKYVQKENNFPRYITPLVVGYSSGATLAYALMVQAPLGTFKGAISMGFCPDLPLLAPLCAGSGLKCEAGPKGKGFSFLPEKGLVTPWIVFQGAIDQVCSPAEVQSFVEKTGSAAEMVTLPKVGHGFSVEKNWMPEFKAAFKNIIDRHTATAPREIPKKEIDVGGLPLVEVPTTGTPRNQFAVIMSGDGGWAGIDRSLAASLAAEGIGVVGWNSLQYYWTKRSPDEAARDLARIIGHYATVWKKDQVALIGYSFGADALPFLVNRLDSTDLGMVNCIMFLGLSSAAQFQFHATNWLGKTAGETFCTLPEIDKIRNKPMLYFYGTEEKETVAKEIDQKLVRVIRLEGGHHFGGKYNIIADTILSAISSSKSHK